jgi:hypothetical protein
MKLEFQLPEIVFLRKWWRSRMARVRALESEVQRLKAALRRAPSAEEVKAAGSYWAQKATTEITWNAVRWHVRVRVGKKLAGDRWPSLMGRQPSEEEAVEALREMWREPPVFAPPEAARALAIQIATLHTEGVAVKEKAT